jgi:hypothetical protein
VATVAPRASADLRSSFFIEMLLPCFVRGEFWRTSYYGAWKGK